MTIIEGLLPTDGLEVEHQAIEAELVARAEQECSAFFSSPSSSIHLKNKGATASDSVTGFVLNSETVPNWGLNSVQQILEKLSRTNGYKVTLNFQGPDSKGGFHVDDNVDPVESIILVQLSEDGFFDYVTGDPPTSDEDAEARATQQQVGAGDKLVLKNTGMFHRGRNPSGHDRYNIVIWKEAAPLTLEQAIAESGEENW